MYQNEVAVAFDIVLEEIENAIAGGVYGARGSTSGYPTSDNLRNLIRSQCRNDDLVFEEPQVVAHPDIMDIHYS